MEHFCHTSEIKNQNDQNFGTTKVMLPFIHRTTKQQVTMPILRETSVEEIANFGQKVS